MKTFAKLSSNKLQTAALIMLIAFISNHCMAQVSIPTIGVPVAQNFNTLANTGTANVSTLPTGWTFTETDVNANTTYTAGNGSGTGGDTYSFGTTGSTDRALGELTSGSLSSTFGAQFRNNTGQTITSITISYTGEQWRKGSDVTDNIQFSYSINATSLTTGTYTAVSALNFNAPITSGADDIALDGNSSANRTAITSTITGLNIASNATFWIRWIPTNVSGNDHGLSVDDFSLTAACIPATPGTITGDACVPPSSANRVYSIASVSGATTYTWTVPSGWVINSGQTTTSINATSGASGGNITVTAGNTCGTSTASSLTVTVSSVNNIGFNNNVNTNTLTFCEGATGNTINGGDAGSGPNYQWEVSETGPLTGFGNASGTDDNEDYTISNTYYNNPGTYYFRRLSSSSGCNGYSDVVVLTVLAGPNADAGGNITICQEGTTAGLGGSVSGSATGGTWSAGSAGGTFSPNATTLNATWTPPAAYSGTATLTLTTSGGTCGTDADTKSVTVNAKAAANAGLDQTICAGSAANLVGTRSGTGVSSSTWSRSGTGNFLSTSNLTTTYTPSSSDITLGSVTITLTTNDPAGPCPAAADQMLLTINPAAAANAGNDLSVCAGQSINAAAFSLGTSVAPAGNLLLWSAPSGSFSNAGSLSTSYTPSIASGQVTVTLTSNDPDGAGPCNSISDTRIITVNPAPTINSVNANPAAICFGSSTNLTAATAAVGASTIINYDFNSGGSFATLTSNAAAGITSAVTSTDAFLNSTTATATGTNAFTTNGTAGNALELTSSNSAKSWTFSLSGTNLSQYKTFKVYCQTRESGNGNGSYHTVSLLYSLNGGSFISTGVTPTSVTQNPGVYVENLFTLPVGIDNPTSIAFRVQASNTAETGNSFRIDNFQVQAVRPNNYAWAGVPVPTAGLPPGAGTSSASNASIFASPTVNTAYTVTVTEPSFGCTSVSSPVAVTVYPAPSLTAPANATLNTSSDGTGNCTAVHNWTHPAVNTNCPTTLTVAYTAGSPAPAALPTGGVVTAGSAASEAFSAGVTIVSYTATDQNNNTATTSFNVTVTDNEVPSIICASDVSVNNAAGVCGATVVLTDPATNDNCGVASVTNDHPSNDFPVGTTDVTWTVTDIHGLTNTCVQKVTVTDNEAPQVTCAADVTVNNDPGLCNATIILTQPSNNDNCGVASVGNDAPSDGVFPVGSTVVTWTVTDIHGQSNTCIQNVTVNDNEAPQITCPDAVRTVTDPASAVATITLQQPAVSDNCAVDQVTNNHPGNTFPIGTTIVTWTVTDIHGNSNTCDQTIVVNDEIDPEITCNNPIDIFNTPGNCDGLTDVTYPVATDNSGHVTVTSNYAGLPAPSVDPVTPLIVNGVQFPVGTTTIVWTATDPSDNTSWCPQMITVTDNENPLITCANDTARVNDPGACSAAIVLNAPTVSDNCGIDNVTNDYPGTSFPVGETTVTWTVKDVNGNTNTCTQKVTVTDTEQPTIECAADVNVNTDPGLCTASVTLTPPATNDNCGVQSVTNDHPSDIFVYGETLVTWTVTDIHNNTNTCVQKVTVSDVELPVITTNGDIAQTADNGQCGAVLTTTPSANATDNCGVGDPTGTRSDGLALTDAYPVGETIITWTVTDIHNNDAVAVIQKITVTDDELPVISAGADIEQTADAGVCSAVVTVTAATASDNCGVGLPTYMRSDGMALTAAYPVGETIITWTVTDIHNNDAIAVTQKVTVTDDEIPVIIADADVLQTADAGQCGATLTTIPGAVASDNCGVGLPTGVRSDGLALSDAYPVGETTITWNVTDIHGNLAVTVTRKVTITDDEVPVITTTGDITQTADAGLCTALVDIPAPTTNDNCGVGAATGTRSDGLALTAPYPVGETTITWTVTDIHNNAAIAVEQKVTVTDDELPVISAGADIEKTADPSVCNAIVTVAPAMASDNCGVGNPAGTRSDGLALTDAYPVGETTITWTVTDIHNNAAIAVEQKVTVTDDELPVITTIGDIMHTADAGLCTAVVNIPAPTTNDNCGVGAAAGTRSDGLALTDAYPVGETTITWTVTDIHNNAAIAVEQKVTVTDDELPVISAGADIQQTADPSVCNAIVTVAPATASDNCGVGNPAGTRSDGLALTDAYPVGETTITWNVTDIHNNAAIAVEQKVTVTDDELPVITITGDIMHTADAGLCTAVVNIPAPTTNDNCGVGAAAGTRSDGLALTAPYPVGETTITWTVTDIHNNAAIAVQQKVTVTDDELPVISAGAGITKNADAGQCGAAITITAATATDNCGVGNPAGTRSDGLALTDAYPVGQTVITWTVRDIHGNDATVVKQTINVIDAQLPQLTCPADIILTTCNGVTNWGVPVATDNCPNPTVARTAGPAPGSTFANGSTTTITYTATDANGNQQSCSFTVTRPATLGNSYTVSNFNGYSISCFGGNNGSINLTVTGGKLPYTYVWTGTGVNVNAEDQSGLTAGTYNVTATDADGCTTTASITLTQPTLLTATCNNSNPVLYFGYTLDQKTDINVKPSGGAGPYKVEITMNRPINCNMVNSSGDEIWAPGANTSTSSFITCPTSGSSLGNPVSKSNSSITAASGYTVSLTLMQNAVITAKITDANGCETTCSTNITAEDVRCFAGNSGNHKIKVCHRTGNTKDPCHEICIDTNALRTHLAHGDFVGKCTAGCIAPPSRPFAPVPSVVVLPAELTVKVMPNPTASYFNVKIMGKNYNPVTVRVIDVYGRVIYLREKTASFTTIRLGDNWTNGSYFIEVTQGDERKIQKVIKAN